MHTYVRTAFGLALGAVMAAAPAAQLDLLVSLTADDDAAGEVVRDQDLVFHAAGGPPRVGWPSETLALLAGDGDGDGENEVPGDVDALHDGGAGATSAEGLYLSLLSDEGGFKDGDVLTPGPDGWIAYLEEAAVVAAVGSVDGQVDLDAFHLDPDGGVLFSLAEDEDSTILSGDLPGRVRDGAILSWAAGAATAVILHTEDQVAAMVGVAVGGSPTIGDTKALARDETGAVLFTVQSPSDHDGSVFSAAGGGMLLSGHGEADFGFSGSGEIDALTVAQARFPTLTTSSAAPQASETVSLALSGAQPGEPYVLLASLDASFIPSLSMAGWGGLVLVDDMLLAATAAAAPWLVITPGGLGTGQYATTIGPDMLPVDVVVQAVALLAGFEASNPILLEVAQ